MKKKIFALVLAFAMALSLVACGGSGGTDDTDIDTSAVAVETEEEAEEEAEEENETTATGTKEDPADPTEVATIDTGAAEFTVQLLGAYAGQDAVDLLDGMGEDADYFGTPIEDGYRLVVLEYAIEAVGGFEDSSLILADYTGGEFWSVDFNSQYDYYCLELMENAAQDFCDMDFHDGDSGTIYAVYNLPESVDECMMQIGELWFHYELL